MSKILSERLSGWVMPGVGLALIHPFKAPSPGERNGIERMLSCSNPVTSTRKYGIRAAYVSLSTYAGKHARLARSGATDENSQLQIAWGSA
ncbi:hypothetical protein [Xanthomonas vasicola]|uniref:hypothetical protein n=1 Tax=Xanthomonas vasicola TaxID=56459 RepID=UPI000F84F5D8|nr:hypothetical protein [Xanthomonas vasicola]AZR34693.1 hypothetical protein NX08_009620 [Xanthomonas vasicola]